MRTHRHVDRLNLALGRAVADKLRRRPALFDEVVRRRLQRWRETVDSGGDGTERYLAEWEALAARGLEACLAQIVEESERATALRQASPFSGVLTSSERMDIVRTCRAQDEAR